MLWPNHSLERIAPGTVGRAHHAPARMHGRQGFSALENASPGYRNKLHHVRSWLIEFDENGLPGREIGLGESGNVVLAGPSDEDYGFWLDTNMTLSDFVGEPVSQEVFDQAWHVASIRSGS